MVTGQHPPPQLHRETGCARASAHTRTKSPGSHCGGKVHLVGRFLPVTFAFSGYDDHVVTHIWWEYSNSCSFPEMRAAACDPCPAPFLCVIEYTSSRVSGLKICLHLLFLSARLPATCVFIHPEAVAGRITQVPLSIPVGTALIGCAASQDNKVVEFHHLDKQIEGGSSRGRRPTLLPPGRWEGDGRDCSSRELCGTRPCVRSAMLPHTAVRSKAVGQGIPGPQRKQVPHPASGRHCHGVNHLSPVDSQVKEDNDRHCITFCLRVYPWGITTRSLRVGELFDVRRPSRRSSPR